MTTVKEIATALSADYELVNESFLLNLPDVKIAVRSNSPTLLKKLTHYFSHSLTDDVTRDIANIEIIAIEREPPELGLAFVDWKREPGKTGRKDAYIDLQDGRVIKKVRTGMVFLQSKDHLIAAGPCLVNDNQLINYVNMQYMNVLQQQGALICHAAALIRNDKCLAIAGFSGGGKSTLMLHLLEESQTSYLTNDRLFLKHTNGAIDAYGIPKLPRINPGTMMNNERLRPLLPESRQLELSALSKDDLWALEEKYDVFLEEVYAPGKVVSRAKLCTFLILNWQRNISEPCNIEPVDIHTRQDLLPALMKSPGVFYQHQDGRFFRDDTALDERTYLTLLKDVVVYEVSGVVDFDYATRFCRNHII